MATPEEKDRKIFQKRLELFRRIEFFKNFDDNELLQFQTVSTWLKVPADTRVIREGISEKAFYIIVQGRVSVDKAGDKEGERVELTTLESGDTFGEMAIAFEGKRTAGVKTLTQCYLVRVEPDLLGSAPVFLQLKFYRRFCEILVERLVRSNERVAMFLPGAPDREGSKKRIDREKVKPQRPLPRAGKVTGKTGKIDITRLPPVPRKKKIDPAEMRQRIQSNLRLQINPAVAGRIPPLLDEREDAVNTRRLLDLIAMDPVLSTMVLKAANSPGFGKTSPVQTPAHAMINIGVSHLREMLANEDLGRIILKGFGGFAPLASSFWRHSVVVGRIADLLKDIIAIKLEEDAYLAGLLHDLGTLVVDREEPDFYPQLLRPDFFSGDTNEQEKAYTGVNHCRAGYWYAEKAGLPRAYLEVILFHHAPERAKYYGLLVSLINLANLFARNRGVSMAPMQDFSREILESPAWNIIRQWHRPFFEVDIDKFIDSFNMELDRSWRTIVEDIPLL